MSRPRARRRGRPVTIIAMLVTSMPTHPDAKTITVPPSVNAKTAQKHDYLSNPGRRSFDRRTAVERSNARIKDPATIDVARGTVEAPAAGLAGTFPLDEFTRERLLNGWDDIGITLRHE